MTRISGVDEHRTGPLTRIAFWFTRRQLRRLAGSLPPGALEPLRVYARNPGLLRGYGQLEQATAALHGLPQRLRALAELRAATLTGCEYCTDLGSQVARRWGLSDAELLALPHYESDAHFGELDRLVLDYATGMCRTPVEVSDVLVEALRRRITDDQLLELTHVVAVENLRGRFNLALGIGSAGFSRGAACAVPLRRPADSPER